MDDTNDYSYKKSDKQMKIKTDIPDVYNDLASPVMDHTTSNNNFVNDFLAEDYQIDTHKNSNPQEDFKNNTDFYKFRNLQQLKNLLKDENVFN